MGDYSLTMQSQAIKYLNIGALSSVKPPSTAKYRPGRSKIPLVWLTSTYYYPSACVDVLGGNLEAYSPRNIFCKIQAKQKQTSILVWLSSTYHYPSACVNMLGGNLEAYSSRNIFGPKTSLYKSLLYNSPSMVTTV